MPSILKWYGREIALQLRGHHAANVRRAADILVEAGRKEAPVDTGELRDSIQRVDGDNERRTDVRALASYARYVHDGTRKQKANPFMLRAQTRVWNKMKRELERRL